MAVVGSFLQLKRLRTAIQKVRFLLSFDVTKWIVSSPSRRRRLSFKDQPGLLDAISSNSDSDEDYQDAAGSSPPGISWTVGSSPPKFSRTVSSTSTVILKTATSPSSGVSRTTSDASSSGDDIDERAEAFIANFYRHIQLERQVSLELRYCNKTDQQLGED